MSKRPTWPSLLHKLIGLESDDVWETVMDRIRTHPQEVRIQGGYGQTALHTACYRYPPEHVVRAMLEVYPEAAHCQNRDGETPLHLACEGASEEVQLMIVKTGGRDLAVKVDKYGDAPLHLMCAGGSSIDLIRMVLEACPEMILTLNKKGVAPFFQLSRDYELATSVEDIMYGGEYWNEWEKAVLLLQVAYHGTVAPPNAGFRLLHAVASVKCPRALVRVASRFFPAGALVKDEQGKTPLVHAVSSPLYEELNDDTDCEESADPAASGLIAERDTCSISTQGIQTAQSVVDLILSANSNAASIPDREGRLPLTLALESGKDFSHGLHSLVLACPRALETRDVQTHLFPFMTAAVHNEKGNHKLDTIYGLLRAMPTLVRFGFKTKPGQSKIDKASKSCSQESGTMTSVPGLPLSRDCFTWTQKAGDMKRHSDNITVEPSPMKKSRFV